MSLGAMGVHGETLVMTSITIATRVPAGQRWFGAGDAATGQALKEDPQPQVERAFGLRTTKFDPASVCW